MAYLILCTFEVGGWPRTMAEVLNRNGTKTFYVSVASGSGHDSSQFHGASFAPWDLSAGVGFLRRRSDLRAILQEIRPEGSFATGIGSDVLAREGLPYRYWSYGWDLDTACFWSAPPASVAPRPWVRYARHLAAVRRARRTIRDAHSIMVAPYQLPSLARVAPDKPMFFLPHLVPVRPFAELEDRRRHVRRRLLAQHDATHLVFSATRHQWRDLVGSASRGNDVKGIDVMLHAFSRYCASAGRGLRPKLIFVRKGLDVSSTDLLARELGISSSVVWVREMPRGQLTDYYLASDACLGQFGRPVLTHSAVEPLAHGTPTASYVDHGTRGTPFYSTLPPLCNSRDADRIASFLVAATDGDPRAVEMRRESWEWVRVNCSESAFVEAFVKSVGPRSERKWAS